MHHGNPEKCGRACEAARGDDSDEYDEESIPQTLAIRTTVRYDQAMCTKGAGPNGGSS